MDNIEYEFEELIDCIKYNDNIKYFYDRYDEISNIEGFDINFHTENSKTLLINSILSKEEEIFNFLLKNNADINIICKNKTLYFPP